MTIKARVALFIDAENASPEHIDRLLARCREIGKPTIARCYGNPSGLKKWGEAIAGRHLMPMQTPPSGGKENASDFALTIDVVSLLHRNMFDHAVIVSSDADFTQLAIHIREHGKGIDGIGEIKTPKSMRAAFDTFIEIPATTKMLPSATDLAPTLTATQAKLPPSKMTATFRTELRSTFDRMTQTGKVTLATFGKAFKQDHPGIDLGKGKLKKNLMATGFKVTSQQEVTLS